MQLRPFVLRLGVCAALCVPVTGCYITPAAGPFSTSIRSESSTALPYALVDLDKNVARILAENEPAILAGAFTDRRPPTAVVFGIGDTVSVTIFEAAAGGLFIPAEAGVRPGNFVSLPNQTVDNDGNISVPYAGTIPAAGRTNVQVQNDIIARIRNRAIDPQVVVALAQQNSNLVSVFGAVNSSVRFPAPGLGAQDRITDAITRAGGITGQGAETWVMLDRKGHRATVPLANLIYQPANNIYIQPGDRIFVYQEPQKFFAFGATGQQGEFPFGTWRINVAEAVAKASGLLDNQADPGSVFLYRREPREVAEKLGVKVDRFKSDELIPVVFNINLRDPGGYFVATAVQMRNSDVIFAANSAETEILKVLVLADAVIGTTSGGIGLRNQIKATANF